MLRSSLIFAATLTALGSGAPAGAAGLVSTYVAERGDGDPRAVVRGRVQGASETQRGVHEAAFTEEGDVAVIDVYFGMGSRKSHDAATHGFVPSAGRAQSEVRVSRGPRPASAVCLPEGGEADVLAGEAVIPGLSTVRLR